MTRDKWIWMPHPGHFICGSECRFTLNTYVGGYVVSTVGEYWPDVEVRRIRARVHGKVIEGMGDEWDRNYFKEFGFHELGYARLYETMVFKARRADKGHQCCPWVQESGSELDFAGYQTAEAAADGHKRLCVKWSKKNGR